LASNRLVRITLYAHSTAEKAISNPSATTGLESIPLSENVRRQPNLGGRENKNDICSKADNPGRVVAKEAAKRLPSGHKVQGKEDEIEPVESQLAVDEARGNAVRIQAIGAVAAEQLTDEMTPRQPGDLDRNEFLLLGNGEVTLVRYECCIREVSSGCLQHGPLIPSSILASFKHPPRLGRCPCIHRT